MTELLSCPFCGGDVSFHKDEECPGCHLIQCGQCRAFFDFATGADPGNDCASVGALRAAIAPMWNARAQLAAIQGGVGEDVVVLATVSMGGVEYGIGGAELGDIDIQPDMKALCALQQSLVTGEDDAYVELIDKAQHQRITAAMAAEVERLSRMLNNATNDGIKLADERDALRAELERMDREAGETIGALVKQRDAARAELAAYKALSPYRIRRIKAVTKERDALRAELAEVKGREAACFVVGKLEKTAVIAPPLPVGTKLYTTPPASPDVEGLVKALEKIAFRAECFAEEERDMPPHSCEVVAGIAKDALSTWRQAQASQQKGKA